MDILTTGATVALTFALIYYHVKKFTFWSSRGIDGPLPIPFFGTNYYYMLYNKVYIEQEWAKKYGRTYGMYQGYKPLLQTHDNEIIKQVFIKKFSSMTDRDSDSIHGDQPSRWLFFTRGSHWTNQRALISPLFSTSKMRVIVDKMSSSVDRFLQNINSKLGSSKDESATGKTFKKQLDHAMISRDELMSVTMDALAYSFYSLKIDTYKDKASEFYKRAFAFAEFDARWAAIWLVIPKAICKRFQIDLTPYSKYEYFDKLSQKTIDERRNRQQEAKTKKSDVIQGLLDANIPDQYQKVFSAEDDIDAHYNDNQKHSELEKINQQQSEKATFRKFDDIEIRAHMSFFFLAGFETTSSALVFCFYELGHQQAAQEEVYQELIEETKHLQNGQITDHSDVVNLRKLDAFVSETLRLYNPVTVHQRVVTAKEGVELECGSGKPIKLPQGTIIQTNGFIVQRDPEYWIDPTKFDMSRFYQENKDKIKACTYMPFGIGPRNCVGMRFALIEMKLLLANTLLKYRIHPGPKSQVRPPKFKRHFFFLQLQDTDFKLVPRDLSGNQLA